MNIYKITLFRESPIYTRCSIDTIVNIDFDELPANDKDELTRDGFLYVPAHRVIIDIDRNLVNPLFGNYGVFREKVMVRIKKEKLKEFLS